jgi:hypothetical protein
VSLLSSSKVIHSIRAKGLGMTVEDDDEALF